ncbi:MAG: hypothetical protein V1701_09685 [Planctomycetota bacterium]
MLYSQKTVGRFYIIVLTMMTIMLCIWIFTVSFSNHKKIKGKLELCFPKNTGMVETLVTYPPLEGIRISMEWDASTGKTKLMIGSVSVESLSKLEKIIQKEVYLLKKDGYQTNASPIITRESHGGMCYNIVPVFINVALNVPWQDVVNVITICKKSDIGIVLTIDTVQDKRYLPM